MKKEREYAGLLEAMKEHNLSKGFILTYNQEDREVQEDREILVLPVWKWLSSHFSIA